MTKMAFEKRVPVHGKFGFGRIVEMVCSRHSAGTCDGMKPAAVDHAAERTDGNKLAPRPEQFVFGRIADAVAIEHQPEEAPMRHLADLMAESDDKPAEGPAAAGMAFLGQFIDHDVTLDATTELGKASGDVTRIRNFRTPQLDLDCVYGDGPEVDPWLYDMAGAKNGFRGGLVHGTSENDLDLQRNELGRALIGDPRNDENLFLSQVHGRQFVAQHNAFAQHISDAVPESVEAEEIYKEARAELRRLYHETIVHRFLPAVVADSVYAPMKAQAISGSLENIGYLDWSLAPDMPVEFSAAAFRFGHSMIRETYKLNDKIEEEVRIFARDKDAISLKGFSPVHKDHNLKLTLLSDGEKDLFFGDDAQPARPIDTLLPKALLTLPDEVVADPDNKNLAARNMIRGQHTFMLPTGQKMAEFMQAYVIDDDDRVKEAGLQGKTPLWYYILSEAEQHGGKLGPVGGGLVAGVILSLLIRANSPALGIARLS